MTLRISVLAAAVVLFAGHARPTFAQGPGGDPGQPGRGPSPLTASLKVEVSPRQTQVFIDGYYAGIADDFDGAFQQLHIEPGDHEVQLFLPGYRLYRETVSPQPGSTVKVRHAMERLGAGESEPQRPVAAPREARTPSRPPTAPVPPRPASPPRPPSPDEQATSVREVPRGTSGGITVRVQPADAQVFIDGERWSASGDDERLVVQLTPGPHTIEARKSGYRGYLTEVNVRAGETLPVNVALTKEP